MKSIIYDGGHAEVEVPLRDPVTVDTVTKETANGPVTYNEPRLISHITAPKGIPVEVPDELAARLLEQDDWIEDPAKESGELKRLLRQAGELGVEVPKRVTAEKLRPLVHEALRPEIVELEDVQDASADASEEAGAAGETTTTGPTPGDSADGGKE